MFDTVSKYPQEAALWTDMTGFSSWLSVIMATTKSMMVPQQSNWFKYSGQFLKNQNMVAQPYLKCFPTPVVTPWETGCILITFSRLFLQILKAPTCFINHKQISGNYILKAFQWNQSLNLKTFLLLSKLIKRLEMTSVLCLVPSIWNFLLDSSFLGSYSLTLFYQYF